MKQIELMRSVFAEETTRRFEAIQQSFQTAQQQATAAEERARNAEARAVEAERAAGAKRNVLNMRMVGTSSQQTTAASKQAQNFEHQIVTCAQQDESANMDIQQGESPETQTKLNKQRQASSGEDSGDNQSDNGVTQKTYDDRTKGKQRKRNDSLDEDEV